MIFIASGTPSSIEIMEAQDEVVNFVPGKNLILTCIVTDGRPRVNISWQIDDSSNMLQISNANFSSLES